MAKSSSYNTNSAQQAAQEAAQRAKEEKERKQKIQNQITAKNNEIARCNGFVSELQSERNDMNNSLQKWINAKTVFNQEEISKNVEIKNVFEGTAARSAKVANEAKIIQMDGKMSSAATVKDGISIQETKVNTRISTLNTQIANLRSQL